MERSVSLDLDTKTAFVSTLDPATGKTSQFRISTAPNELEKFKKTLRPDDILCMEACPGSRRVYRQLKSAVAEAHMINPTIFGAILDAHKSKNDRNDSGLMGKLHMAGALPTVWVPDEQTQDERQYMAHRMDLDGDRTRTRNRIISIFLEHGFAHRSDELLKMKADCLLHEVRSSLPEQALESLASKLRQLAWIESEIRLVDARITATPPSKPELIKIASTLPGVSYVMAFAIGAAIGDITRFKTPNSLPNGAGVTPSLHSSGPGKPKHGRIKKRGSQLLRWAAIEAADNARRVPGRFRNLYRRLIRKGKHHSVALVACARELLVVLWHMLTKHEEYKELPIETQQRKQKRRAKQLEEATQVLKTCPSARTTINSSLIPITNALQSLPS